jgi:branched-chain amino acid transport system substrate-binding protein
VKRTRLSRLVPFVAVAILVASCADDDNEESSATTTEAPAETSSTVAAPTGEPIPISVMYPAGLYGATDVLAGATSAVEAINAAGGVKDPAGGPNRPFELVACGPDPQKDPNGYVQCARDAIAANVIADVGKVANGTDEVTAFAEAGIPMVGTSPTGAQDFINDHVFPLSGGALAVQGIVAALQADGAQTIGLVTLDVPTGKSLAGLLAPVLTNKAADIISQVYLPPDPSADLTPFVAQVVDANPDGVLVAIASNQFGQVFQALRAGGYTGKIGTSNTIASPDNLELLGDAAEGLVISSDYRAVSDTSNPLIAAFNEDMAKYADGEAKDQYSLNAWLAVRVLRDVLENEVTEITPAAVLEALNGYPVDLEGVAPPFTLGTAGGTMPFPRIPRATVQFQIVKDGAIVAQGDGEFVDLHDLLA